MRSGGNGTGSELPDVDHAFVVFVGILGYRPGFCVRNQRATHVAWTGARMVRDVQGGCAGNMWCRHARTVEHAIAAVARRAAWGSALARPRREDADAGRCEIDGGPEVRKERECVICLRKATRELGRK